MKEDKYEKDLVEKCIKYRLTLEELFVLECIFFGNDDFQRYAEVIAIPDELFFRLRRYDLIQKVNPELPYVVEGKLTNLELTDKGTGILLDKVQVVKKKAIDWIDEYRKLFKGIKPQSMGDRKACEDNMRWFLNRYPNFTKEQIIQAAKKHIADNSAKPQYTRRADYFIKKQDANRNVVSDLLMYLENEDIDNIPSDFMEHI